MESSSGIKHLMLQRGFKSTLKGGVGAPAPQIEGENVGSFD